MYVKRLEKNGAFTFFRFSGIAVTVSRVLSSHELESTYKQPIKARISFQDVPCGGGNERNKRKKRVYCIRY
jgi:hypothetical protein